MGLPPLRRRRRGRARRRSAACRRPARSTPTGLDIPDDELEEILAVDVEQWKAEIAPIRELFDEFGDRLPAEVAAQLEALEERLSTQAMR